MINFAKTVEKSSRRSLLGKAAMILLVNFAATIVAVWLQILKSGWQNLSWKELLASLVYSNVIGTLISLTTMHCVPLFVNRSFAVRWLFLLLDIFVVTYVGCLIAGALLMLAGVFPPGSYFWINPANMTFSFLIALVFGISGGLYEAVRARLTETASRLQAVELDRERALRHVAEAQFAALESRLHPHFLFNTLNSIAALVREDADLAEKTVERLADLLRYSLDANASRLVELKQELEITVAYLEIERARFGERLNYAIDVDEQFLNARVPPFALQTLVENSIKHVAAKRPGAIKIAVAARVANNLLEIKITDDGAGFAARDRKNGHGLDTLQKRIAALFGDAANLEIVENVGFGQVILRVPLRIGYEQQTAAAASVARLFG